MLIPCSRTLYCFDEVVIPAISNVAKEELRLIKIADGHIRDATDSVHEK